MVVVELDVDVVACDCFHRSKRVVLAFQQVIWLHLWAERFKGDVDAVRAELFCGVADVFDKGIEIVFAARAFRHDTGHHVHGRACQRNGILQCLVDIATGIGFATGQGGKPPFARCGITGSSVEQHLLQAVLIEQRFQLGGGIVIRPQVFNIAESGSGGCGETLREGALGEHHGEVGCKFGHGYFPRFLRSSISAAVR